jgi:DHA2 family multidrug resistance protein
MDGGRFRKWLIALSAMLATSLEAIDAFILNVSLDHVRGSLSAGVDEVTWVLTAYLVANSIIMPFTGWLAKRFGHKQLFLASTAVFTLSSLVAGAAPNLETLIAARFVQGLGGGSLLPLSQTIMLQTFPGKERAMAMAIWGVGVKLGPIAAPLLGGWISDNWGWRWVFYINIPIGIAALLLANHFLEGRREGAASTMRFDVFGAMLLTLGIGALQLFVDLGQREDWFNSRLILHLAIIAAAALVLFIIHELRQPQPIVRLGVFANPVFTAGCVLMFWMAFGQHGSLLLSPLFTKHVMDYTAFLAGLALAPGGLAHLLTMPVTGVFLNRIEPRWFMATGCMLAAASMYQMAGLTTEASFAQVTWPRFIQGIGFGLIFVSLTTVTLSSVPQQETASAAGLFNLLRNLGGSIGIALVRTSLERDSQTFQSQLVTHINPYEPSVQERLQQLAARFIAQGADAFTAHQQALTALYKTVQRQASLQAFLNNYYLLTLLFLVLIPFFFLLRRGRLPAGEQAPKVGKA